LDQVLEDPCSGPDLLPQSFAPLKSGPVPPGLVLRRLPGQGDGAGQHKILKMRSIGHQLTPAT